MDNSEPAFSNRSVNPREEYIPGLGRIGLYIFLGSLSMLFSASIIGYLIVRSKAEAWPPPGMPSLPGGLWVSTLILLLSSGTMYWAQYSIRRDRQQGLRIGMTLTWALGAAFLISQWINWRGLISSDVLPTSKNMYAFTFYMLTGLHAAHVIGGLILLGVVTRKAYRGTYYSLYYPGVEYSSMYWHFLDVIWLILFALLIVAG